VDDNPLNVDLVVDILEAAGWSVIPAYDGRTAVTLTRTERPDLVILDVNMPNMSGYEVCRVIKGDAATAHIPVIMVTALIDVDYRIRGLEAGADDYLTKPYSARELIARIETRLRAKNESDHLRQIQTVLRDTFERFVHPRIVEQLLKDPSQIQLGGTLQNVTVMYTDLENFTTVSEVTPPELLLTVLNSYHRLVVEVIMSHGGTIDKFMGDSVMALFNTPVELDNHVRHAVDAALAIQETLPAFHAQFEQPFRMNINIGIHTGMAIVGNVGAPQVMSFTAVGDTVNIASRLQAASKGGRTLISQAVHDRLDPDHILLSPEGDIALRGRTGTVRAYTVLGRTASPAPAEP
jgi:class 3 adenylate cyclase/CheY-like chemotaxis protein